MKKNIILTLALSAGILFIAAISSKNVVKEKSVQESNLIIIDIPENVQAVINNSCYGCHNSKSKNKKGKLNLKFDYFKTGDYSPGKVVGKLNNIIEAIDDGSMPPKKFSEKYPEKKLNKEDASLLRTWADDNIKKLTEE